MSPYHWYVRLDDAGIVGRGLYFVMLFDGKTWERTHVAPLPHTMADRRAMWLTDVLSNVEAEAVARREAELSP